MIYEEIANTGGMSYEQWLSTRTQGIGGYKLREIQTFLPRLELRMPGNITQTSFQA